VVFELFVEFGIGSAGGDFFGIGPLATSGFVEGAVGETVLDGSSGEREDKGEEDDEMGFHRLRCYRDVLLVFGQERRVREFTEIGTDLLCFAVLPREFWRDS